MSHLEERYLEVINKESKEFDTTDSLITSYKDVVFRSVVTSFGLDMLLFKDRRGGQVDTIHTVRDSTVKDYASSKNQKAYDNRGEYDSGAYHNHVNYKNTNKQTGGLRKSGNLIDGYTGKRMDLNKSGDLDHIVAAKKVHDQHINRTYYTSKKFLSESAIATANMGFKMGIREATGLIIMDTWVIVEEEFPVMAADMKDDFSLEGYLNGMKELFQSAYRRVRDHWKEHIKSF